MTERVQGDIAHGRQSDNRSDEDQDSSSDRTRAFAYGSDLGRAITRLATERTEQNVYDAASMLMAAVRQRNHFARGQNDDELRKLVNIALTQWLQPNCGRCKGRGEIEPGRRSISRRRMPCPKCSGEGKHEFTYGERSRMFGHRLTEVQERRIDEALRLIYQHEHMTGRVVSSWLRD